MNTTRFSDEQPDRRFSPDDDEEEDASGKTQEIHDETETDLVNLRRTIYLTIQSSMQADEAAHKLMKLQVCTQVYLYALFLELDLAPLSGMPTK